MGHAVAQLVEALRYKTEGRGFDSRWCHWHGRGVNSASNRNEYQEYFLGGKCGRCIGLTTLPAWWTDCLEIWEPQPPRTSGPIQACTGIVLPSLIHGNNINTSPSNVHWIFGHQSSSLLKQNDVWGDSRLGVPSPPNYKLNILQLLSYNKTN